MKVVYKHAYDNDEHGIIVMCTQMNPVSTMDIWVYQPFEELGSGVIRTYTGGMGNKSRETLGLYECKGDPYAQVVWFIDVTDTDDYKRLHVCNNFPEFLDALVGVIHDLGLEPSEAEFEELSGLGTIDDPP